MMQKLRTAEDQDTVEYLVPLYTTEISNVHIEQIRSLFEPIKVRFYPEFGEGIPTIGIMLPVKKTPITTN